MGLAASLPLVTLSLTPQLKLERMQKMLVACGTLLDNWEIARSLKACRFDEISGAASAGPSPLHGRGLIAARDAPAGSILALYPVHALGDEKHCLADQDLSGDFEAATSRPYRVDAGHASLKSWAPDLWVDASPNVELVDGWLGHLVNDAAACSEYDEKAILAYYSAPRNVVITRLPDAPPLLCWVATRDLRAGDEAVGLYGHDYWLSRGGGRVPAPTAAVREAAAAWKAEQRQFEQDAQAEYATEFATLAQFVAPRVEEAAAEERPAERPRGFGGGGGRTKKRRGGRK